jgi:hypothetical protein
MNDSFQYLWTQPTLRERDSEAHLNARETNEPQNSKYWRIFADFENIVSIDLAETPLLRLPDRLTRRRLDT